jgi:uncharacterized membrane protein YagU involved in acid resistance
MGILLSSHDEFDINFHLPFWDITAFAANVSGFISSPVKWGTMVRWPLAIWCCHKI